MENKILAIVSLLLLLNITGCANINKDETKDSVREKHNDTFVSLQTDQSGTNEELNITKEILDNTLDNNMDNKESTETNYSSNVNTEFEQKVAPSEQTESIVKEMKEQYDNKDNDIEPVELEKYTNPENDADYFDYSSNIVYTRSDFSDTELTDIPYEIGIYTIQDDGIGYTLYKHLAQFCTEHNLDMNTIKYIDELAPRIYKDYTNEIYNISNKNIYVAYNNINGCYIKVME